MTAQLRACSTYKRLAAVIQSDKNKIKLLLQKSVVCNAFRCPNVATAVAAAPPAFTRVPLLTHRPFPHVATTPTLRAVPATTRNMFNIS